MLITKTMPTELVVFSCRVELKMVGVHWYRVVTCSWRGSGRWVSCNPSNLIFLSLMSFDTATHFKMRPGLVTGEVHPFMLMEASLKFAVNFFDRICNGSYIGQVGWGSV